MSPSADTRRPENLALLFQNVLTAVVRLRANRQGVTDADAFRHHTREALKTAASQALAAGYTADDTRHATFAAVAFLDESVLNSQNPIFVEWLRKPLQAELFGTHTAGEEFFVSLQQLLGRGDSADLADLIEIHYLCLLLGFNGRYSAGNRGELAQIMNLTGEKIRRIRDAEKRTGRTVNVSFNYRFAPTAARLKQLLLDGAIGTLTSVDFHWYLDTRHGADYFRRWHAYVKNSGSLFVHKATHHFDLLNWYIAADPESVSAFGVQRNYGPKGPFRGMRCKGCEHASKCDFYFDIAADPLLEALYEAPSVVDGYVRDACVYREDIDIPDTMSATIRYENQVLVSYSLNTFMPIEGYTIAFNGTQGRIETRLFEKQPFEVPEADEILVVRNFGKGVERIPIPHAGGGHFGGDDRMRNLIFHGGDDPLGQRAGSRAGAMSVMIGAAALKSSQTGEMVRIAELGGIGG